VDITTIDLFCHPATNLNGNRKMKEKIPGRRDLLQGKKSLKQKSDQIILLADDDLDYHLIVRCALEEIDFRGTLTGVMNGVQLMDYLCRRGKYEHAVTPDLIILDLNMPQRDGASALREIKHNPRLRRIPVAVMSTSVSEPVIELCRGLYRCSCTEKPCTFGEWTRILVEILSDADCPSRERKPQYLEEFHPVTSGFGTPSYST